MKSKDHTCCFYLLSREQLLFIIVALFSVQHVISEPFEQSPFMPSSNGASDNDFDAPTYRQQKAQPDTDAAAGLPIVEKESNTRENNVAKIKVVVCQLCVNNQLWAHFML